MSILHLFQHHCAEVNYHYFGVQYYINCNWMGDKDWYQSEFVSHAHSTWIDVYEFGLESWEDLGRHHHGICHCCSGSSSQVSISQAPFTQTRIEKIAFLNIDNNVCRIERDLVEVWKNEIFILLPTPSVCHSVHGDVRHHPCTPPPPEVGTLFHL